MRAAFVPTKATQLVVSARLTLPCGKAIMSFELPVLLSLRVLDKDFLYSVNTAFNEKSIDNSEDIRDGLKPSIYKYFHHKGSS